MKKWVIAGLLAAIFLTVGASAQETNNKPTKNEKKANAAEGRANAETAKQVREEFLHAWDGYKKYAWGHDEVKPLSNGYRDWHKDTLLMTPVDALDTMMLM